MDEAATARAYYAALDEGRYEDLRALLAPEFTQRRPDRTFEGREAFLAFMRDDRPHHDTTHELDGVYGDPASATSAAAASTDDGETVLVRGVVRRENGDVLVRFVDCFELTAGRIVALETYTR